MRLKWINKKRRNKLKVEVQAKVAKFHVTAEYDEETQGIVASWSIKTRIEPGDLARILYLKVQKGKPAMFFSIGSLQAQFDLDITQKEDLAMAEAEPPASDMVICPLCLGKNRTEVTDDKLVEVACTRCHGAGIILRADLTAEEAEKDFAAMSEEADKSRMVEHQAGEQSDNGQKPKRRGRKAKDATLKSHRES